MGPNKPLLEDVTESNNLEQPTTSLTAISIHSTLQMEGIFRGRKVVDLIDSGITHILLD